MNLVRFDEQRLPELMRWFGDESACRDWGGPHFRFPYTASTFRTDASIDVLPTWSLLDDAGNFVAFGQYYLRLGRCHLAHLAVAPEGRGSGIGTRLIRELCTRGAATLRVAEFSLFVLARNASAERLYRRLGFVEVAYPEPLNTTEPMRYLVARGEAAAGLRAGGGCAAWNPTPLIPNCE